MHDLLLSLGSNLGDRLLHLSQAVTALQAIGHLRAVASCYRTAGWGVSDHPPYLNTAVWCQTPLAPQAALQACQSIEHQLGRQRPYPLAPRNIDIDLLYHDQTVLHTETLLLPHPRLHLRRFVLVPLAEIVPDWSCPLHGHTIAQLLERCPDQLAVERLELPTWPPNSPR